MTNMTDGAISHGDLPLVPFSSTDAAEELVKLGLWNETEDGYQVVDFQKYQTSSAHAEAALDNRRKSERERQARKRSKEKEDPEPPESRGQSRDSHVTVEGKERQGKERQGEEDLAPGLEEVDLDTGEIGSTSDPAPTSPPAADGGYANVRTPDNLPGSGKNSDHVVDATEKVGDRSTVPVTNGEVSSRHAPGPDELWPDGAPAKGFHSSGTLDGPRPYDFNQFRNPAMREGAA
ncbi:hypothetical protein [Nesterenkonia sp. AN1]|uniref:hypothetical protein n=1 Tax=Nesterenkonia sp. AN1 TaxID=652017 RepID=UPI0013777613|nr:hypothetical protein [Nesterenkonia sp. AN1]